MVKLKKKISKQKNNCIKKVISLLLCCIISISFFGCSEIEVELTPENFTDYFFLEVSVENFQSTSRSVLGYDMHTATADIVITCKPRADYELNNVVAQFKLYDSSTIDDWHEIGESQIISQETPLLVSANLSVRGELNKSIPIQTSSIIIPPQEPSSYLIWTSSVSGTVKGPRPHK